jgi:phenylpropionate dioxygenase-like ring-hydroxylating dioxygenase large terminal subunit
MTPKVYCSVVALLSLCHSSWSLSSSSAATTTTIPPSTTSPPSQGRITSLNRDALDAKKFPRTWVPIASTFELDPDRPTPIDFLGQRYVTYQDNDKQWVVLDDACPHRLAPLSEGRIDREANVLSCSYHGWEFDSSGACTRIPQATAKIEASALRSKRSCVAAYPACVEKQILWIWPWKEDVLAVTAGNRMLCPEGMMEDINDIKSTYTRDLPYGWAALVENLIDPSHVPFAHHGMQGKRTDAIPINMTLPIDKGEAGFSFDWEDRTGGFLREGKGEFRAPYLVSYDATFESKLMESGETETRAPFLLSILNIPTKPGWSRTIIMNAKAKEVPGEAAKKKKKKTSWRGKIFSKIPVALSHVLSNRFLDSDLAFLHFQERERERRPAYFMPAPADRCIESLLKWIPKYTDIAEPLSPALPRAVLFDRYTQHTSHCKHCQAALVSIKKWRHYTYAGLAMSILGFKFRIAKVTTLLCLGILRTLQKLDNAFKEGEFKHYLNH